MDISRSVEYQEPAMTILIFTVILVLVSTLVKHFYPDKVSPLLTSFSAIENTKKLFTTSETVSHQHDLTFLHSVRVSLRFFGLLGHIYLTLGLISDTFPVFSISMPEQWFIRETWKQMFIFIEVFFVMSGFLTVYTWYPQMKRSDGSISFYRYVTVRFLRSTPLFFGILILIFALSGIGSGPIYSEYSDTVKDNCVQSWWTNVLYISNWMKPTKMCYPNWWSVSIDFQLYCLSYLPMVWIVKDPRKGIWLLLGLIGLSSLISSLAALIKRAPLLICCDLSSDNETQLIEHISTYTHAAPYFIGMLTGYLVVTDKKIKNPFLIAFGYIVSSLCWLGTFFASYYLVDSQLDQFLEVVYIGIQKICFSVFYGWLFYAFSFRFGGALQRHMSNKLFVPFSRLTYSIAMSEMLFIWYDVTNSHQYFPAESYNEGARVAYIFVMCTIIGYLVFLLFEAPTLNLVKVFIKPKVKPELILTQGKSISKLTNTSTNLSDQREEDPPNETPTMTMMNGKSDKID